MFRNHLVPWTLAALASLAAVLVGVGLVWGPALLPTDQARALVEAGGARLGLTLRIAGPVRLKLLPRPALVAETVTATGPGGFAGEAGRVTADLAFGPLLHGEFAPRDVTLRDAVLNVPTEVALASAPDSPATLQLVDARGLFGRVELEHVDAAVALYGGKLVVDGSATWRGQRWRLDATRDRAAPDGASAVQAAVAGEGAQAGVAITAALRVAPDGAVTGHANARGPDLSAILPGPAVAFAAEGRIVGDATLLIADMLNVTLAGQTLQGSVTVRLRPATRVDVALTAGRLDARPWLDSASRPSTAIPVGLDLAAEEVPVPGGAARRMRLLAEFDGHGATWREVAATLPGEARLRYVRREAAGGGVVDGRATLALPDPSATLAWARRAELLPTDLAALPDPPEAPIDLAADARASADGVHFEAISGSFGPARITGRLVATRADGPWPIEASLGIEPVQLASRWPDAMALCSSRPVSIDGSFGRGTFGAMPLHDGHARLRCGPAGGTLIADATLNGGVDARFAAGVAPDGAARALDVSLIAPQTAMTEALLPKWAPSTLRSLGIENRPGWLRMRAEAIDAPWTIAARSGPLGVAATVRGTADTWSGNVRVDADALGDLRLPAGLAAWTGAGRLSLAGDISVTPTGVRVAAGSFLVGTVAGRVEGAADGTADGGRLDGSVALDTAPMPAGLSGLSELGGWTGVVQLRADHLGSLSAFSASVHLDPQVVALRELSARIGEGTLRGEVVATRSEPPDVRATLDGHDLPLDGVAVPGLTLSGTLDGVARLATTGTTGDQLKAGLSGTLDATVANAVLRGADLAALAQAIVRGDRPTVMPTGVTAPLSGPLTLRAAGGLLAIGASTLDGPAGRIVPSGVLDLAAGTLDLRLNLTPKLRGPRADPTLTWRIAGPLASPAATLDPAGLDLWRAAGSEPVSAAVGEPISATPPGDPAPRGPAPQGGRRR